MRQSIILAAAVCAMPFVSPAAGPTSQFIEYISALTVSHTGSPVSLKKSNFITTKATFKPPVEILVEAKTESLNLRLGYAADQVIFNWERDGSQLRIDGGPADGNHKVGMGAIPKKQYVIVRWLVTPRKQSIFVDGQLRFEHTGDYSTIDKPVTVFGSEVTVKSIKVRQLPPETE